MKFINLKQLGLVLGLTVLAGLSISTPVSAHVLKSDNGVAAVLHIPPYDAPVANTSQQLQFQFGTTSGSFQISDYKVAVTILNGDHVVQKTAVVPPYFGANAEEDAKVLFPQPAVYTVNLSGVSQSGAPNFAMTYEVRVTGAAKPQSTNGAQILLIGVACLIILAMVATRQIVTGKRYAAKPITQIKPTSKIISKKGRK